MTDVDRIRTAVAATARRLVAAGLIEAFGHVSARCGDGIAITSTRPLAAAVGADVLVLDAGGTPMAGPVEAAPLERALHVAIYAARPDVGAICRGHPASTVVWGTGTAPLPLLHGLGAMAGADVRVHPDPDLITTTDGAEAVAATLGTDAAVILRANGALAVGADLDDAAARLWFLEERATVALRAPVGEPIASEVWARRQRHTPAELRRAMAWFAATFDTPIDHTET